MSHQYADLAAIRARKAGDGLQRLEYKLSVSDEPFLAQQIPAATFALVENDFEVLGQATKDAKKAHDEAKREAERDGLPFEETEPDMAAHWKGDKVGFFVNLILACTEHPKLDPEVDREWLMQLPFGEVFEVGSKLLEFIGGEASQENIDERQRTFQGDEVDGADGAVEIDPPAEPRDGDTA